MKPARRITRIHHSTARKNCTKAHAPHPRNLRPSTTTPFHTSQLRKEHTATHGSHLNEQTFKIRNRETSGPLATPPPADTALMPNSGSLCNGQGVQTYVEVQHPSIAVLFELSFSAARSVHCILLVLLGFFFVEFFAQSTCPLRGGFAHIVQHTSLDNHTLLFACRSRYAALIAMQSVQKLELRSKTHTSGPPSNPEVYTLGRLTSNHARHKTLAFQTTTRTFSTTERAVHSREILW